MISDINECNAGSHNCSSNAFCNNTNDPTTALVSLDIREMEGPVQVNNGFGE